MEPRSDIRPLQRALAEVTSIDSNVSRDVGRETEEVETWAETWAEILSEGMEAVILFHYTPTFTFPVFSLYI